MRKWILSSSGYWSFKGKISGSLSEASSCSICCVNSEGSDKTALMPRLAWNFTVISTLFTKACLNILFGETGNNTKMSNHFSDAVYSLFILKDLHGSLTVCHHHFSWCDCVLCRVTLCVLWCFVYYWLSHFRSFLWSTGLIHFLVAKESFQIVI